MNDFDFFVGSWDVANGRLRRCLVDGDDQEEFRATSECVRLFGGAANMDEISMPDKGYRGLTLRLFDPVRQLWSLYWVSSRDGALQPPVVDRFADGVGLFFGDHGIHPARVARTPADGAGGVHPRAARPPLPR